MSISSDKGKSFEQRIAKALRRHGVTAFRNKRSGAGDVYKADIDAPGFRFSIEAKAQETIKLRDWWAQSCSATPSYKEPMLVVELNGEALSVVRLDDILELITTVAEDAKTIADLRSKLKSSKTFLE